MNIWIQFSEYIYQIQLINKMMYGFTECVLSEQSLPDSKVQFPGQFSAIMY